MKLTNELLHQLKSAAQEEIMCRESSDTSDAWQDLASPENILALIEIALPVLEQQEKDIAEKIYNDGWIEWGGGDCPIKPSATVQFKMRGGEESTASHGLLDWSHEGLDDDIVAYRVIENDGREG